MTLPLLDDAANQSEYITALHTAIGALAGVVVWLATRLVNVVRERDKERVQMLKARDAEIRHLRGEKPITDEE